MVSGTMVELFQTKGSLLLGGSARICWLALRRAPPTLGETNLSTGLKEVLPSEDIFGSELTKVLLGSYLAGEERRGETNTILHTTARAVGNRGGRGTSRGTGTDSSELTLLNRILRLVVKSKENIDQCDNGEDHK